MTDMPARRVDLRSGTVALPADEMHQAMSEYNLNLFEDRLEARDETRWPLAEGYRIIYLVAGEIDIAAAGKSSTHGENSAWFGTGACVVRASADGARLWRWELVPRAAEGRADYSTDPNQKASHAVSLEPEEEYLMRCDRVDFPPGGIAYTHTHAGPRSGSGVGIGDRFDELRAHHDPAPVLPGAQLHPLREAGGCKQAEAAGVHPLRRRRHRDRRGMTNANFQPLAQVPDVARYFFHDPNLTRLIAAPQWGRKRVQVDRCLANEREAE